jgi:hypothetical protein
LSARFELLLDRGGHWQAAGIFPSWRAAFRAGDRKGGRFSVNPVHVKEIDA